MSRVRITTPVSDHSGVVGNVFITDGVAHADTEVHAAEIAYCRRNGYTVEELPDEPTREDIGYTTAEIEAMEAVTGNEIPGAQALVDSLPNGSLTIVDAGVEEDTTPRRNGSAEAWRAYAVAHGMSAEDADALTRDQLVERFTSNEESE